MRQSEFKTIEKMLKEAEQAYREYCLNCGAVNCDFATFVVRCTPDLHRRLQRMNARRPSRHSRRHLVRLLRDANRHTPLDPQARHWAPHVVDYLDGQMASGR